LTRSVFSAAAALTLCVSSACSDRSPGSEAAATAPSNHPQGSAARLHGTVDVAAGTLTFEPLPPAGATLVGGSPDAAIYGNQGVTVRIYNSAVVASAPSAGKRTYSANVGVRNLLAYRIGDEQGVAAPPDTMGIYVFLNTAPVVTATSSPCAACVVTVKNRDGTLDFNAVNQAYWFYPELLGPANGGKDTTLARKPWVFEADTQVTSFSFDVLVSAPWVAPNETVWRVTYPGDSLPAVNAEPKWRRFSTQFATPSIVNGNLQIDLRRVKDSVVYVRYDSISTSMNALIEGRFRLDDGGGNTAPQPGLAFDDQTRFIGVFVSDSGTTGRGRVGFVDALGTFLGNLGASDTIAVKQFHVYQLRKYGADSATVWIDGARRLKALYSTLPLTKSSPSLVMFGFTNGVARTTTTTWDYVFYQLGQATP
jgi:hypothetical protein